MSVNLYDLDASAVFSPAWETIQQHHPELPACRFELTDNDRAPVAATTGPPWMRHNGEIIAIPGVDELTVTVWPKALRQGGKLALGTLLHEAAHILEWQRYGCWADGHGRRFAWYARHLGLVIRVSPSLSDGCRVQFATSPDAELCRVYAGTIAYLDQLGRILGGGR